MSPPFGSLLIGWMPHPFLNGMKAFAAGENGFDKGSFGSGSIFTPPLLKTGLKELIK